MVYNKLSELSFPYKNFLYTTIFIQYLMIKYIKSNKNCIYILTCRRCSDMLYSTNETEIHREAQDNNNISIQYREGERFQ